MPGNLDCPRDPFSPRCEQCRPKSKRCACYSGGQAIRKPRFGAEAGDFYGQDLESPFPSEFDLVLGLNFEQRGMTTGTCKPAIEAPSNRRLGGQGQPPKSREDYQPNLSAIKESEKRKVRRRARKQGG